MKKIFLLCCLFMACSSTFAQKKYLVLNHSSSDGGTWCLCGDIPEGMKEKYHASTSVGWGAAKVVANILNELAEKGYEVEFMPNESNYLLSKKESTDSYNATRSVKIDDEDVTEIARYNLQGIPVNANEKGVQIIVYSNYTTRTIIVQ